MNRPLSVTLTAWLYIATGALSFASGPNAHFHYEDIAIALVRLAALLAGIYMLRAREWARWLAIAWIAFHVILSAFHSMRELAVHALFCALIAYLLLRVPATQYFRTPSPESR